MSNAATFADITAAVAKLAAQIRESDWHPDVIVAVARGGLTPAHWLAHQLDVPRVTAVDVGFVDRERTQMRCYAIPMRWMDRPLLVEDAVDTGRLLRFAAEQLAGNAPEEVRTAALFRTERSPHVDFVAETVAAIPVMPWEVRQGAESVRLCAQCQLSAGVDRPVGDPECPHKGQGWYR